MSHRSRLAVLIVSSLATLFDNERLSSSAIDSPKIAAKLGLWQSFVASMIANIIAKSKHIAKYTVQFEGCSELVDSDSKLVCDIKSMRQR